MTSMNPIDITPLFWPLVRSILTMEYNDLRQTSEFREIIFYVDQDNQLMIAFGECTFVFDNINDMFYGMAAYYTDRDMDHEASLLENAIEKMCFFLEMNELSSMWTESVKIT